MWGGVFCAHKPYFLMLAHIYGRLSYCEYLCTVGHNVTMYVHGVSQDTTIVANLYYRKPCMMHGCLQYRFAEVVVSVDTPLMCWPQIVMFKDDTKVSIVTISPITDSESMALLDHSIVSFIHTIVKETSFRGCLSSKHSYNLCTLQELSYYYWYVILINFVERRNLWK